jgi:hypothetical protein
LLPLPIDQKLNLNGTQKVGFMKSLHEMVKLQIEKRKQSVANKANKGRKKVVFKPGE